MRNSLAKLYAARVLKENVNVNITGDHTGTYNLSRTYFDMVVKPALDESGSEQVYLALFKRGVDCGLFNDNTNPVNEINTYLKSYIDKSADVNEIIRKLKDERFLKRVGDMFISKLENSSPFNFLKFIGDTYNGDFEYDDYLINKVKPVAAAGKTRGASGPGEIFLAYFLNGEKPVVGDLEIGGNSIEVKKDNGRIGKDLNLQAGSNYWDYVENKSKVINKAVEEYKCETLDDFIQGKGHWGGICGTQYKIKDPLLDEDIGKIKSISNEFLIQVVGCLHIKDYIKKIQKFDYLYIFSESHNGESIGFKSSVFEDKDILNLIAYMHARNVMFWPKRTKKGRSQFDTSGFGIRIMTRKAQKPTNKASFNNEFIKFANIRSVAKSDSDVSDLLQSI